MNVETKFYIKYEIKLYRNDVRVFIGLNFIGNRRNDRVILNCVG